MIVLIRHTLSITNLTHKDVIDPGLSKIGIKQATTLFGDYDFILISPLLRTRQTYLYSNLNGSVVEFSSLCREKRSNHNPLSKMLKDENGLVETDDDFAYRMHLLKLYVNYLSHTYSRILIITHHAVIMYLTGKNARNGEYVILNN